MRWLGFLGVWAIWFRLQVNGEKNLYMATGQWLAPLEAECNDLHGNYTLAGAVREGM